MWNELKATLPKGLDLPEDVIEELSDSRFAERKHYQRGTYNLGCRGPLCRLAEARRGRRLVKTRAEKAGREYKPNMLKRDIENELALMPVLDWYISAYYDQLARIEKMYA